MAAESAAGPWVRLSECMKLSAFCMFLSQLLFYMLRSSRLRTGKALVLGFRGRCSEQRMFPSSHAVSSHKLCEILVPTGPAGDSCSGSPTAASACQAGRAGDGLVVLPRNGQKRAS